MRWRSRERKCKIETHIGTGHEIAKREGVELWRMQRVVGAGLGLWSVLGRGLVDGNEQKRSVRTK